MKTYFFLALLAGAVIGLAIFSALPPETASLALRGHQVRAEVVRTPQARSRGLSGRPAPVQGEGMLFVSPETNKDAFWMKGCVHPLDIAWLDQAGKVVALATMPAPSLGQPDITLPKYAPSRPYAYALECTAGTLAAWGVQEGDQVDGLPR